MEAGVAVGNALVGVGEGGTAVGWPGAVVGVVWGMAVGGTGVAGWAGEEGVAVGDELLEHAIANTNADAMTRVINRTKTGLLVCKLLLLLLYRNLNRAELRMLNADVSEKVG